MIQIDDIPIVKINEQTRFTKNNDKVFNSTILKELSSTSLSKNFISQRGSANDTMPATNIKSLTDAAVNTVETNSNDVSNSTSNSTSTSNLIGNLDNVSNSKSNSIINGNPELLSVSKNAHSRNWSLWSNNSSDDINKQYNLPLPTKSNDNTDSQSATKVEIGSQPNDDNQNRSRGWSLLSMYKGTQFHNDNDTIIESQESPSNSNPLPIINLTKPLTNSIIHESEYDLTKTQSKIDCTLTSDKEFQKLDATIEHPNIVVPQFNVLPESTVWSSISYSLSSLASNLNIISHEKKEMSLQIQSPKQNFYQLSDSASRPINILIVGVHGFFPTKMLRPFIGEPTGTSLKFVNEAEVIVRRYFEKHNTTFEINKIALEKEGKIFERVDYFFEVMKRYQTELNSADFIYFVAHSQGSPVTMILLGKLLEAGILKTTSVSFETNSYTSSTRGKKIISVLAMAGINNGPFFGADRTLFVRAYSTIESDSLRELFEFQNPESTPSKSYIKYFRILIANNVKVTFVGSINDQLVPLYSSICLFARHPNVFRATFIDKGSRTPSFITRVVDMTETLLNLGYDDHGIIKEISEALAGTLTGGGHSTIYNEAQVYELGLKFSLETTDLKKPVPVTYMPYAIAQLKTNPYNLPWCMRGLLSETNKTIHKEDIETLIKEFELWKPVNKNLKEMKYRLNGLISKF
ncbi:hypothetical protein TPHA_0D02530 [Tetrapisispora phaffii CBS 4417]|uniref:YMC020W-like alpha/beta hydrolase domain-containing protein n=1 Tax=Tetrapisispora phaffii (strain ATCC 24235 / CBS 4417 / NBRC 1672 / NRRL Y-8282 / UCD 70-5) TaxID=1071381 RepID=G8BSR9_TETPH|nr:hypothetical protein TPHA_0D02530 [Tetrapisispora phaffii CBS 4417]CCE62890.1 hypothetical protein TPHA_0D02530 [Tetrapisispora phaffii CBS 4417]